MLRQVDAERPQAIAQLVEVEHAIAIAVHAIEDAGESADAVEAARGGDARADAVHGSPDLGRCVRVGLCADQERDKLLEVQRVGAVQVIAVEEGLHLPLDPNAAQGRERGLELVEGDHALAAGVEFLKVELESVCLRRVGGARVVCEAVRRAPWRLDRCAGRTCLRKSVNPLSTSILRRRRDSRSSVSTSSVAESMFGAGKAGGRVRLRLVGLRRARSRLRLLRSVYADNDLTPFLLPRSELCLALGNQGKAWESPIHPSYSWRE